jgi:hypothetical protein
VTHHKSRPLGKKKQIYVALALQGEDRDTEIAAARGLV